MRILTRVPNGANDTCLNLVVSVDIKWCKMVYQIDVILMQNDIIDTNLDVSGYDLLHGFFLILGTISDSENFTTLW